MTYSPPTSDTFTTPSPEAVARIAACVERSQQPSALTMMERLKPSLPNSQWYRDAKLGIESAFNALCRSEPSLLEGGKYVVEVGPGAGCFMIVAKALGNTVVGEELPLLPDGTWVQAYAEIARFWGLHVRYYGFHRFLLDSNPEYVPESVDMFHFRGSLDGVLIPFKQDVDGAVERLVQLFVKYLKPGGEVRIAHNVDPLSTLAVEAFRKHHGPLVFTMDEPVVTRLVKPA